MRVGIKGEVKTNNQKRGEEMKAWIFLNQLFCVHKWEIKRLGLDGGFAKVYACMKCGKYREVKL